MTKRIRRQLAKRKRRIEYRLRDRKWPEQAAPMFKGRNLHYEVSDRGRGVRSRLLDVDLPFSVHGVGNVQHDARKVVVLLLGETGAEPVSSHQ